MKKKPRVGILMPAYNQGPYIHEAIESLKKQTFQDFKVKIVDDASTDGVTIDILKTIKYNKAEVILSDKNVGIHNLASEHLRLLGTEFVFILCADDKIKPSYIEKCVRLLDKDESIGAVGSWIQCFGESDETIEYKSEEHSLPNMLVHNRFLGSSIVRADAFQKIKWGSGGNENFRIHHDWDRWVSILKAGYSLGVIEEHLFMYRILGKSLSHGASLERETAFRNALFDKHKDLYKKYHEYVIKAIWKEVLEHRANYREYITGHRWLDLEYKKQKRLIKKQQREIKQIKDKLARYRKYSAYPLIRAVKDLVGGKK